MCPSCPPKDGPRDHWELRQPLAASLLDLPVPCDRGEDHDSVLLREVSERAKTPFTFVEDALLEGNPEMDQMDVPYTSIYLGIFDRKSSHVHRKNEGETSYFIYD